MKNVRYEIIKLVYDPTFSNVCRMVDVCTRYNVDNKVYFDFHFWEQVEGQIVLNYE